MTTTSRPVPTDDAPLTAGPFRGGREDRALAQTFGIAVDELAAYRRLRTRALEVVRASHQRRSVEEALRDVEEQGRVAWATVWDLADTARACVVAHGRDVEGYDALRDEAKRRDVDETRHLHPRRLYWSVRPIELAEEAFLRLRAAVPWCQVVELAPVEDLRPSRAWGPVITIVVLGLFVAGVVAAFWSI